MTVNVRQGMVWTLALACSLGASAAAEDAKRTSPTIAREAADENARTPAGRRYQAALEAHLDRWLKKALERCAKGVPKDELVSFEAFVCVSGAGESEELIFVPETDVSRCVEPDFRDAKYPQPPEPRWWVRVAIRMR
jgi:hypothetical protein